MFKPKAELWWGGSENDPWFKKLFQITWVQFGGFCLIFYFFLLRLCYCSPEKSSGTGLLGYSRRNGRMHISVIHELLMYMPCLQLYHSWQTQTRAEICLQNETDAASAQMTEPQVGPRLLLSTAKQTAGSFASQITNRKLVLKGSIPPFAKLKHHHGWQLQSAACKEEVPALL